MADVAKLLASLSAEEKVALTAGADLMSTVGVARVGIPAVALTDGPNGARGPSLPGVGGTRSTCTPCGSAIGATWDPVLAEQVGALVGREALERGCRGLLAPTVNLHRSPLAGRNFECYSEDPLLAGRLAAAYVAGVQRNGVLATVKHFVANEAEFERGAISSVVDERSLRELYLVPFELAVRDGGALGIMTAYNRLNGSWVTEQPRLLLEILREEWGFQGLVMTDWFGVADGWRSLRAGLDLEMPGPGRTLGAPLLEHLASDPALREDLDAALGRLLGAWDAIGALDGLPPVSAPREPEAADRALLRRVAAESVVLLANDGELPLAPASLRRVAVVGAPAAWPCIQGGGSAQVSPHPMVTPLDALSQALPGVELIFERGCEIDRSATVIGRSVLVAPAGFEMDLFAGETFDGTPLARKHLDELRLFVFQSGTEGFPDTPWCARISGTVVPSEDGRFELALAQVGRARLVLDGRVVLDGFTNPPPPGGRDFFGLASRDLRAEERFSAGKPVDVVLEFAQSGATTAGVRVGYRTLDTDGLLERAVTAAGSADVTVVFVGTTAEWETEGRDRSSFGLPGRQDELVRRVAAADARTVVVVNAGAPVDLPWVDEVAAVLQCWFGGQAMGEALADVLTGRSDPAGRLPTTVPRRLGHNPSFDNFPGENGEVRYGEGVFMGYRGYEHREIEPRFAFGHGLSYARIELGLPSLSQATFTRGGRLVVSVPVRNTADRPGAEVVQCYVAPRSPRLARPPKELKAFGKVRLGPGEEAVVVMELDDRSFAYWDPGQPDLEELAGRFLIRNEHVLGHERRPPGWQVDPGVYDILIGRSSADIAHRVAVEVTAG